jgi:cell division protein FtsB
MKEQAAMAFSKSDGFLAKLVVIAGKVERMRADIEKLTLEMNDLRARVKELEARSGVMADGMIAENANVAELKASARKREAFQAEAKQLKAHMDDLSRQMSAGNWGDVAFIARAAVETEPQE